MRLTANCVALAGWAVAVAFVGGCATTAQEDPAARPVVVNAGWPNRDTYCREARTGVSIASKRERSQVFECLTDGGDFRTVRVVSLQGKELQ